MRMVRAACIRRSGFRVRENRMSRMPADNSRQTKGLTMQHISEIIGQIRENLNLQQEEEFEILPKIREDKHPLEGWCPICLGSTRPLDELRFLCPRCWDERGRYQPLTKE